MPTALPGNMPHVVVIGGGGTGGAVAHDLALRGSAGHRPGARRGDLGHHRAPPRAAAQRRPLRGVRRGVRRGVHHREPDPAPDRARLVRAERRPVRRDHRRGHGLPAAVRRGLRGVRHPGDRALRRRGAAPRARAVTRTIKAAVRVPDGTMDAMRLPLRFFASAQRNGAVIRTYTSVVGLRRENGAVTGVQSPRRRQRRGVRAGRRPGGQRDGPVGPAGRRHGRGPGAGPLLARRARRGAHAAVRDGDQPAAPVGRRRHRRCRSAGCP